MEEKAFIVDLLKKMEEARPPKVEVNELLTDEFMTKYTQFSSFKEMVAKAMEEAGVVEKYLDNLKKTLISPDVAQPR